jgi:hypothetical protein
VGVVSGGMSIMAKELDNEKVFCEQCGSEYSRIGTHWSTSAVCEYPNLDKEVKEILIGLLMGDGNVGSKSAKNSNIHCSMISKNYLKFLDDKFDWLSTGVSLKRSSKESAEIAKSSGFSPKAKNENYSDIYTLCTRSHPFITNLSDWYSSGNKVWPKDIELTPTVLKHWYCGDGSINRSGKNSSPRIIISMANEYGNSSKISNYFKNVGLPEPSNYTSWQTGHWNDNKNFDAQWTVEESKELWNYMGNPLPDFYYKWPEGYR